MNLANFMTKLSEHTDTIEFSETMAVIDKHYQFTESAFTNGDIHNAAGQNNGSCKLFAFALLQQLSVEQTLACFGEYYRVDVLQHPEAQDHQNIRNFMQHGWQGIQFESEALTAV